jgi:hypothetical protein
MEEVLCGSEVETEHWAVSSAGLRERTQVIVGLRKWQTWFRSTLL